MRKTKDPAIKLFGKTIPLADPLVSSAASVFGGVLPPPPDPAVYEDLTSSPEENQSDQEPDEVLSVERLSDAKQENGTRPITSEEIAESKATEVLIENLETPSVGNEAATTKSLKTEEERSDTSNSQEKTLRKPDEILPCPRCNSMDTKFCYYNNYNVNQPRYFCKNCQRYWTAGGTMRNVPVGAGRRKNKNLPSHYGHITMPEALQDLPNGTSHPTLKPNGTVLNFGTDTPLRESILDIAESTTRNCARNGFHKPDEQRIHVSYGGDDQSSGSSVTVANSKDDIDKNEPWDPMTQNFHSFPPQVPCFPGAPWTYTWNSPQWSPAFWTPGYLMPFYPVPPPYWGCSTMAGSLNVPWVTAPNFCANLTSPRSPTLGKHSREESMVKQTSSDEEETQKENNPEPYLWIPKTLKIDDLGEAERSSIWTILGIKNDKADSVGEGDLFKSFQSKSRDKNHISDTSSVLRANPAAV